MRFSPECEEFLASAVRDKTPEVGKISELLTGAGIIELDDEDFYAWALRNADLPDRENFLRSMRQKLPRSSRAWGESSAVHW